MKRGLILLNAYASHALGQARRLADELAALGVTADIRRNNAFLATLGADGTIRAAVGAYDFCIYLDKDKYVAPMLERVGLRLFDTADAIEACDDKMTTAIRLAGRGIPMPETLPGLLCYDAAEPVSETALDAIEARLGYPLVAKTCFGSLGKGVFRIDGRAELRKVADELKCVPHLYQRYIAESAGRDLRVIVIGGRARAAMTRRSEGDFRSNLALGGVGIATDPPAEAAALAERAAVALGADYCGVDILFGRDAYYVCEVNSNAFFGGIEAVTGVNIAGLYARHICGTVYG